MRIEQLDEQMGERAVGIAVAEGDEGEDDPGLPAVRSRDGIGHAAPGVGKIGRAHV